MSRNAFGLSQYRPVIYSIDVVSVCLFVLLQIVHARVGQEFPFWWRQKTLRKTETESNVTNWKQFCHVFMLQNRFHFQASAPWTVAPCRNVTHATTPPGNLPTVSFARCRATRYERFSVFMCRSCVITNSDHPFKLEHRFICPSVPAQKNWRVRVNKAKSAQVTFTNRLCKLIDL